MKTFVLFALLVGAVVAGLFLSGLEWDASRGFTMERPAPTLGPADGHDLPPTDIERVALGTEAPDFSLLAYSEDILTLSDYRGKKDVVLVFYRGHW